MKLTKAELVNFKGFWGYFGLLALLFKLKANILPKIHAIEMDRR
jgi:hypothetical protein